MTVAIDLVRTRDPAKLDACDIVVDVGAVYDPSPSVLRFDHHQRGFTENFGHGFVTKLSSAGLIYKYVHCHNPRPLYSRNFVEVLIGHCRHFGKEIIATVQGIAPDAPELDTLYLKIYKVCCPCPSPFSPHCHLLQTLTPYCLHLGIHRSDRRR